MALAASARFALAALTIAAAQSVYWSPGASLPLSALVTALAALAVWRPTTALLALALLAPFGRLIAVIWLGGFPIRGAEALALAFLAGIALRYAVRPPGPSALPMRLTGPWVLFATCVVASAAVLYRVAQFYLDYPGVFFGRLLTYVAIDYQGTPGDPRPWSDLTTFGSVETAALVVEGVALLLVAARLVAETPGLARRLVVTSVTAGVVTALMSIGMFAETAISTATSLGSLVSLAATERIAVHVTKVNTAGSYFVMLATLAGGMALGRGARRVAWLLACLLLLLGLWLTASLAAILSGAVVATVGSIAYLYRPTAAARQWRTLATGIVVAAVLVGLVRLVTRPDAASSFWRRVAITQVSLDTMAEAPVFGVGIGDYPLRSQPHVTEQVREGFGGGSIAPHNYVLHVAAELGVVGLALFVWALAVTFGQAKRSRSPDGVAGPAAAAFAAFLLSSLAGQPMLVDAVAIPAWLTLALLLAMSPATVDTSPRSWWVPAGMVAIIATLPFRMVAAVQGQNFPFAGHGTTLIEIQDGTVTRLVHRLDGPARLFVSGTSVAIALRASASTADSAGDVFLTIRGPGVRPAPLRLPSGVEREACLPVEPGHDQARPRALDLDVVDLAGDPVGPGLVWARVDGLRTGCGP